MPICEEHTIGYISKCPTCEFEKTLGKQRGFTKEESIMHRNLLKKRTKVLFTGYRPQFYFRTTNADGAINLPERGEYNEQGRRAFEKLSVISTCSNRI